MKKILSIISSRGYFKMKAAHSFLLFPTNRNTSGVVGVSETTNTANGKKYPCFAVTYYNDFNVLSTKKFYFTKKLRIKAFEEAVEFRKKYENKLVRKHFNS